MRRETCEERGVRWMKRKVRRERLVISKVRIKRSRPMFPQMYCFYFVSETLQRMHGTSVTVMPYSTEFIWQASNFDTRCKNYGLTSNTETGKKAGGKECSRMPYMRLKDCNFVDEWNSKIAHSSGEKPNDNEIIWPENENTMRRVRLPKFWKVCVNTEVPYHENMFSRFRIVPVSLALYYRIPNQFWSL